MGIDNRLPRGLKEFDIIIAGGGTAGCVVAGRLARADPTLSILVVEGGNDSLNDPTIRNPGVALHHLRADSKTAIFNQAEKSSHLNDRAIVVPSGGVLGGGIPEPRLETYDGPGNSEVHGSSGPVHVSDGGFRSTNSQDDFIAAARRAGIPEVQDLQDLKSFNGVSPWLRYVSPCGMRQDTAHTYLQPLLNEDLKCRLQVLVQHKIVRVLFDEGKRATGVEIIRNVVLHPESKILGAGARTVIRARKLVVVSCGACGTPVVLERSGIGRADILHEASVPLVADVQGVGQNYQDHNGVFPAYKTFLPGNETNNALVRGGMSLEQALAAKDPRLHWNTVDVAAKIRPTEYEVVGLGRPFRDLWEANFQEKPKPLMLLAFISAYVGADEDLPDGEIISIASYSAYPFSRGSIHISGPHVEDVPRFDTGYLSDPSGFDMKAHAWAYKKQREIMRRTTMYRGELASSHPKFCPDSKAACVDHNNPEVDVFTKARGIRDIEYSEDDDQAIEQYLRDNLGTTWHSLGTAKMAPREKDGVVDKDLNVYGVTGLKVIDLSIAPENVGANTNNTAIVIGEKGADIIIKELQLIERKLAQQAAQSLSRGDVESPTESENGDGRGAEPEAEQRTEIRTILETDGRARTSPLRQIGNLDFRSLYFTPPARRGRRRKVRTGQASSARKCSGAGLRSATDRRPGISALVEKRREVDLKDQRGVGCQRRARGCAQHRSSRVEWTPRVAASLFCTLYLAAGWPDAMLARSRGRALLCALPAASELAMSGGNERACSRVVFAPRAEPTAAHVVAGSLELPPP
ncbi:GMC oxidoreductase [Diplocarpon mali]|nr:GMC oxidoreductase [Diplocarpon mali]